MNLWLLATVLILIVSVVVLVGCFAVVAIPLKNTIANILLHVEGIEKQMNGIQTQTTALTVTVDRMKTDIVYKKTSIQAVIQSVKDTNSILNEASESAQKATLSIVKDVQNDAQKQAQIEQWTNTVMGFLNRKAQ